MYQGNALVTIISCVQPYITAFHRKWRMTNVVFKYSNCCVYFGQRTGCCGQVCDLTKQLVLSQVLTNWLIDISAIFLNQYRLPNLRYYSQFYVPLWQKRPHLKVAAFPLGWIMSKCVWTMGGVLIKQGGWSQDFRMFSHKFLFFSSFDCYTKNTTQDRFVNTQTCSPQPTLTSEHS